MCCFVFASLWLLPHGAYVYLQLSAMDVSARTTMKGAAKCDKHCDLQNSVNQQGFERILRFRDIPESMPASVSTDSHAPDICQVCSRAWCRHGCVSVRQGASALDAFSTQVASATSNLISTPCVSFVAQLLIHACSISAPSGAFLQDMKLGQQTR